MSKNVDWTQLVRGVETGTPGAFDELVKASDHRLEKVCYTVLKQPQDVEDVKQETYEKIYLALTGQGRAPLRDPAKFPAWAEKIARYTAINYLDHKTRKTGRDETRAMTSTEESAGIDILENDPGAIELAPDQFSEEKLVHELISSALDTLSVDRRQCLALWQEGYKYQEISEKLNIPIGTVRSHIHYGRIQLKKTIQDIEDKYQIKIHGFALSLLGGEVVPHFTVEHKGANTGWIQAAAKMKEAQPETGGKQKPLAKPAAGLARKIIAVVATLAVITAGIVFAMHYAKKAVSPSVSRRSTTAVERSVSANRQSPGNSMTRPTRSAVENLPQNNAAVAPAPQTQAPVQTTAAPTTQTTTRVWQENSF